MSSFSVEVVRLDDVLVHPNADALELAVIGGYRAVVQKGIHKAGDAVLYVPEDAILPVALIEEWGFTGRLAGKAKNRVKAIKLRQELSQGLVLPAEAFIEALAKLQPIFRVTREVEPGSERTYEVGINFTLLREMGIVHGDIAKELLGYNLADALGITKYEPDIPATMGGFARPRPSWFPMYSDIENIKKYNRTLVPDEEVVVTEKIHGTNFGAGMHSDDFEMLVSSRRLVLQEDDANLYWRAAKQADLRRVLSRVLWLTGAKSVVIYGEVFGPGVQDLGYGVEAGQIGFRWFDLMLDGRYVSEDYAMPYLDRVYPTLARARVLYRGPFNEEIVKVLTDGKDTIAGAHIREGVVIKPVVERETRGLGRVILKSISEDYLLRKNGTERH